MIECAKGVKVPRTPVNNGPPCLLDSTGQPAGIRVGVRRRWSVATFATATISMTFLAFAIIAVTVPVGT